MLADTPQSPLPDTSLTQQSALAAPTASAHSPPHTETHAAPQPRPASWRRSGRAALSGHWGHRSWPGLSWPDTRFQIYPHQATVRWAAGRGFQNFFLSLFSVFLLTLFLLLFYNNRNRAVQVPKLTYITIHMPGYAPPNVLWVCDPKSLETTAMDPLSRPG